MRLALIQQHATTDKQANLERGLQAARQAIENSAQVICFAELAFEPFYPQHPAPEEKSQVAQLAEGIPGPVTFAFSELAREHGVVFVLNLFEKEGDQTFDSSPVIGTDGQILGVTRMIHITDYPCFHEQDFYDPGDRGINVFSTEFGKIGVAICYDRHFPEYMRKLALDEADLVLIPQAGATGEWPEGLFEAELQVASFQNGYFTALCNRVGQEECLEFAGESFVCDPDGKVIARAGQGTDEILYCDLDYRKVHQSNARRLFLRDRRPELYASWAGR